MRARTALFGVLLAAVACAGLLAGHRLSASHAVLSTPTRATTTSTTVSTGIGAVGGSPRERLSLSEVLRGFVVSYASYLDGSLPAGRLRYASVTVREQASSGGRIPVAFRDGPLRIASIRSAGTAYSAQVSVVLANRSESYPFSVQLLGELGWRVAQIVPPDLSIDQQTTPLAGPAIPRAGQAAAGRFAVGYVRYRAAGGRLAGMTAAAAGELSAGQDPLAGRPLPAGVVRLAGLRYGPLERDEFSVTATVTTAGRAVRFTFLMAHTPAGWECEAFL